MSVRFSSPRNPGAIPEHALWRLCEDIWNALSGRVRLNARGHAQPRLEAIDTLETHYAGQHQPMVDLATRALDFLLTELGIRAARYKDPNRGWRNADGARRDRVKYAPGRDEHANSARREWPPAILLGLGQWRSPRCQSAAYANLAILWVHAPSCGSLRWSCSCRSQRHRLSWRSRRRSH